MASADRVPLTVSILCLALVYSDVLGKVKCQQERQVDDPECLWTAWSPCTVTCVNRGSNSIHSQQWQRLVCKNDNNSSISTANFRSCAHTIPLCVSDEGFLTTFQNYLFLAVLLTCILLAFLPNMILGLRYTRVWVWKSRKFGQKSEQSVPSFKEVPSINLLSNRA